MRHPVHRQNSRSGFTFVELAVAMTILLVALLIFSSTISGMAKQRAVNRETNLAVSAARNMIETLRSQAFEQVFVLYDADPNDDPGGAATGPGNHFAVPGLDPTADAPGGMQGEIVFPTVVDPLKGLELREDLEDRQLGMPRDLSGDNVVDDQDHRAGYFILPVLVRVRWMSPNGIRQYDLSTQLCKYKKS